MLQLINLSYLLPQVPEKGCKNLPLYFFHDSFATSFIWCRRPWVEVFTVRTELRTNRINRCTVVA